MVVRKTARFEGMSMSYLEGGQGEPLLLVQAPGTGSLNIDNWKRVLPLLEQQFHVIAVDLIGFGASDRKKEEPYFDITLWSRQLSAALNLFSEDTVNILGHSLSGYLVLHLASFDRRVKKAMATCSLGTQFLVNEHIDRIWTVPSNIDEATRTDESLVWDVSALVDHDLRSDDNYLGNRDHDSYLRRLFSGDKQQYIDATVLTNAEISNIACPVLLVHGRNDLAIPFAQGVELAAKFPWADFITLARCGHSPAVEHPQRIAKLAYDFFMPESS